MDIKKTLLFHYLYFCLLEIDISGSQQLPIVIHTWNIPRAANAAWDMISSGQGDAVDALVAGCGICEDGSCGGSIGKGGSEDENGETTLAAMVMDGATMDAGGVACLRDLQEAIAVARAVMRYTAHTLMVGEQASEFAVSMGFEMQSLQTNQSYNRWQNWLNNDCQPNHRQNVIPDPKESCGPYSPDVSAVKKYEKSVQSAGYSPRYSTDVDEDNHDTIGMVVVDADGNVAAGTSTNGMTHKVPGRGSDSPLVGAGAYAENGKGGAATTGDGDVMMRMMPSFHAVQMMGRGYDPTTAAEMAMDRIALHYPNNTAAVVTANHLGEHGGACYRFGSLTYLIMNATTTEPELFSYECRRNKLF